MMTSRNHAGFSLVETIVVTGMTALISVLLGVLLVYFYKTNAYTLEQSTAVASARKGTEDAMRYLREASYGSDGSYPIESAATSSIVFYSNMDSDPAIERVSYVLQNGMLYRIILKPTGDPPAYTGTAFATSSIAGFVVNGPSVPLFRYFDDTGTELSMPIDVSKIASLKATFVIDVNPNRAPTSFTLSGGATLRNLSDQL